MAEGRFWSIGDMSPKETVLKMQWETRFSLLFARGGARNIANSRQEYNDWCKRYIVCRTKKWNGMISASKKSGDLEKTWR